MNDTMNQTISQILNVDPNENEVNEIDSGNKR